MCTKANTHGYKTLTLKKVYLNGVWNGKLLVQMFVQHTNPISEKKRFFCKRENVCMTVEASSYETSSIIECGEED